MPSRSIASARTRLLLALTPTLGACALILSPFGCSSSGVEPDDAALADGNGDGATRGTNDDSGGDLGDDPDAAPDVRGDGSDGTYRHGPYLCCGKGQGRSCCPPETLPDPDAGRTATCFQYGGVVGKCTGLGEFLEGKDICSLCCPGLTRVPALAPAEGGPIRVGNVDCEATNYPSVSSCTACGDGVCGDGENACNCPDDCGNPLDGGNDDAGDLPEGGPIGPGNMPEGGPSGPGNMPEGGPIDPGPMGDGGPSGPGNMPEGGPIGPGNMPEGGPIAPGESPGALAPLPR